MVNEFSVDLNDLHTGDAVHRGRSILRAIFFIDDSLSTFPGGLAYLPLGCLCSFVAR